MGTAVGAAMRKLRPSFFVLVDGARRHQDLQLADWNAQIIAEVRPEQCRGYTVEREHSNLEDDDPLLLLAANVKYHYQNWSNVLLSLPASVASRACMMQ